jgi:hypothetical protein
MINDVINKLLNNYGIDITREIKDLLEKSNIKASGDLIKSINYSIKKDNNGYKLLIEYNDYGDFIISGRKPNSTPPPISPIKKWAKLKGIPETAAYPIAKSIGKKGIKPFNFIAPFFQNIREFERQLGEEAALEIERILTTS